MKIACVVALIFLFSIFSPLGSGMNNEGKRVAMLISSAIYEEVMPHLKSLSSILSWQKSFMVKKVNGENPEKIREWLREEYEKEHIEGAILIGNIPLEKYYDPDIKRIFEFPYYYMDVNGAWKDEDGDGIIDAPLSNYLPEIWIGIIRSTDMNGNNATQINEYIEKVIDYLNDKFSAEPRSMLFLDEDFHSFEFSMVDSLFSTYIGVDLITKNTSRESLLHALSKNYAYSLLVLHSDGNRYFIETPNGEESISSEELGNASLRTLFYTDLSCYGGSFEDGAIANHLIMGKNTRGLGVLTYTSEGYVNAMDDYHYLIGNGESFGESLLKYICKSSKNVSYFNRHIAMLEYLGFPFLNLWKPNGYKENPPLSIDGDGTLLNYAEKYGWAGDGSEDNPIIIKNLMVFQQNGKYGIRLSNITLHVRISHCWILISGSQGIYVRNSQNISVENNAIYYSSILVINSKHVNVIGNEVHYNYSPLHASIHILNSSYVDVSHNSIHKGVGIGVGGSRIVEKENENLTVKYYFSTNINVSYNTIWSYSGIFLSTVKNSTVFRNDVHFNYVGLSLVDSINNRIWENNFTLSIDEDITEQICYYVYIFQFSTFTINWIPNRIYLNNFMYSGEPPKFLDFHKLFIITHPIFTFPHPKESHPLNYWNNSKYGNYYQWWAERNDTNDKNGDGIVDYPWVMDENNTDYHPLKSPYVWKVENKNNRVERPYYSTHISIIFILLIVIISVLLRIRKKQL